MDDPNLALLASVVKALGNLCDSLVFVGGCATGLLVTARRAQTIRATTDVDVVARVISKADYHAMERAVEARGSGMISQKMRPYVDGCWKAPCWI